MSTPAGRPRWPASSSGWTAGRTRPCSRWTRSSTSSPDLSHAGAGPRVEPTNPEHRRSTAMSLTRVHNFAISLDGFGTGDGQSADAPFGHAGERLHEWMFATRWWGSEMVGQPGGTEGVDGAFARLFGPGIAAEIRDPNKFAPPAGKEAPGWRGGGGPSPP